MNVVPTHTLCVCGHPESDHKWVDAAGYDGLVRVINCFPCYDVHAGTDPYTGCTGFRPVRGMIQPEKPWPRA